MASLDRVPTRMSERKATRARRRGLLTVLVLLAWLLTRQAGRWGTLGQDDSRSTVPTRTPVEQEGETPSGESATPTAASRTPRASPAVSRTPRRRTPSPTSATSAQSPVAPTASMAAASHTPTATYPEATQAEWTQALPTTEATQAADFQAMRAAATPQPQQDTTDTPASAAGSVSAWWCLGPLLIGVGAVAYRLLRGQAKR